MADTSELFKLFKRLWRLPWDNQRKELFWRLSLDGLPTAARMHLLGEPCACGALAPCRRHHFWDCAVAQAVLTELHRGLAGYVVGGRNCGLIMFGWLGFLVSSCMRGYGWSSARQLC
jgi:hypothetical protein